MVGEHAVPFLLLGLIVILRDQSCVLSEVAEADLEKLFGEWILIRLSFLIWSSVKSLNCIL